MRAASRKTKARRQQSSDYNATYETLEILCQRYLPLPAVIHIHCPRCSPPSHRETVGFRADPSGRTGLCPIRLRAARAGPGRCPVTRLR